MPLEFFPELPYSRALAQRSSHKSLLVCAAVAMSAFRKLTGDLLAEWNFGLRGGHRGDKAHGGRGFCESGAPDWLDVDIGHPVLFHPLIRNGLRKDE